MRLADIDLRLLRVFKAVADAGGFVKAQGVLGINQPAISSHIANLEQRLNVRLCERGRGGFSLTPQGQEVLEEANAFLDLVEEYSNRLNSIGKKSGDLVRIGIVDGLLTEPSNPLPDAIRAAKTVCPDMRPRVGIYDFLDCLSELRANRLDIAIVGVSTDEDLPEDLEPVAIFDEPSCLYCAPDHPCAIANGSEEVQEQLRKSSISAHSFLSNPVEEQFDVLLLDENIEISQGNVESTVYLTLSGTHVGLIPRHFADPWVRSGDLVVIAPDHYGVMSCFHAIRLRSAAHNAACRSVWQELMQIQE